MKGSQKVGEKRMREQPGDSDKVEEYKGPWRQYVGEVKVAKPTEAQKLILDQMIRSKKRKEKEQKEETIDETTELHSEYGVGGGLCPSYLPASPNAGTVLSNFLHPVVLSILSSITLCPPLHACTHTCTHLHTHTHTHTHTHAYSCTHSRTHITHAHTRTHDSCTRTCILVCTHMHTLTHITRAHTRTHNAHTHVHS